MIYFSYHLRNEETKTQKEKTEFSPIHIAIYGRTETSDIQNSKNMIIQCFNTSLLFSYVIYSVHTSPLNLLTLNSCNAYFPDSSHFFLLKPK